MSLTPGASLKEYRASARRARKSLGIVILLLSVLLGITVVAGPSTESTEAAWHTNSTSTGNFQAGTLPGPRLTRECEIRWERVLGIPINPTHVDIYWAPPEGYTLDDAELYETRRGLGTILGPLAGFDLGSETVGTPEEYTTSIEVGLLSGVLGLDTMEVAIFMTDGEWISQDRAAIESNAGILLGVGARCDNVT